MLVYVPAIMGLVPLLLAFMVAQFWTGETVLGACMGVGMLAASLFSASPDSLIFFLFRSRGLDSAVFSELLLIALNDVSSLPIYVAIVRISLHVLF